MRLSGWSGQAGAPQVNATVQLGVAGSTLITTVVPKVSTYLLMLAGLGAVCFVARRRAVNAAPVAAWAWRKADESKRRPGYAASLCPPWRRADPQTPAKGASGAQAQALRLGAPSPICR